ncbi:MAG TPA: amidase [Terriglobales bacterium]|jgi:aspartyl-tRNA(Asn)/glutamyl-tRNA(Gln) amidotransferase subunit A|nr:amidase [Terriglobales bacterium]
MLTSILEISRRLRNRELSPVDLARKCLAQIEKLNPALNAFITVTAESAMQQARQAESEILRGEDRGPLHGIPLGLKDIIDTAGTRTTAASALFKDRVPTQDAEVVQRLRSAGAVFLGKQNLHEFAYGGSSMISYYGEVHNPWNPALIAGGSSGGSAAAVAAGLGFGAIGTDTAGSVREPAAQCGAVGFKPTFGRVSTRGVIPLSSSLDHVGPIARTVSDVAVLLQTIAGFDPEDKNSADIPVPDYLAALQVETKKLCIGIPRKFFYEDLDSEVAAVVELALAVLKNLGCEIREINLEIPTDRTLQAGESYAIHREFVRKSPELYQPETLRRIRSGQNISEAQVEAARQDLVKARNEIHSVFANLDFIVTPAVPIPAPQLAELKQNPDLLRPRELVLLRNTRPFNVWGLPAISVPCGFTRSGLPIGLQIAGPPWSEAAILQLANTYEQATDWHKHEPNLVALSNRARETV